MSVSEQAQPTTGQKLLEIKHISVDYLASNGTVHAVSDVNLTLNRGEVMGLAGESGCGKSTLAYAISRLLNPPAEIVDGEILYYPPSNSDHDTVLEATLEQNANQPIDILKLSSRQLRAFRWSELSIVFQSAMNALNPVMTVGTQIDDALKAHRPTMGPDSRKQRAVELLRMVGIAPDRLKSYPHELSGGMRQRAIIAIALALSPELIIMDEPTTALDVVVQREILSEILRLREELGFSVIFITHDLSLLLELADKVAIMYAGRIIEMASRDDLYEHPRHPYSYGLLNSFPTLRGPRRKMVGIPGSPPDLRAVPAGCAFHPRCPFAFDACKRVFPVLQTAVESSPQQLTACHLYNPTLYTGELPNSAEFAARYEALGERRARS